MTKWKRDDFAGLRPRKPVELMRDCRAAEQSFLLRLFCPSLSAASSVTTNLKAVNDAPRLSPVAADRAKREFSEMMATLRADFFRHVDKKTVKP